MIYVQQDNELILLVRIIELHSDIYIYIYIANNPRSWNILAYLYIWELAGHAAFRSFLVRDPYIAKPTPGAMPIYR